MSQDIAKEVETALAPAIQKIKQWDGSPEKLNDLRTFVKSGLGSIVDVLNRKLNKGEIDAEKFERALLEAMEETPMEGTKEDMKAWAFLGEIFLTMESEKT